MMRCRGCGIELQSDDKDKLGYTTNFTKGICTRCFRLKNYGEYSAVSLTNQEYAKIIDEISNDSLIVYVTDVLSLDLDNLKKQEQTLLVITKKDIIPRSTKEEKIVNYVKGLYPDLLNVVFVSSIKNDNIDYLYNEIRKYSYNSSVYLVGNTNSGKSTLLNKLIYNYGDIDQEVTVSMYPSTTLDKVEVVLKDLVLIDTPGLIDDDNITNYLSSKELKMITPKKEIKPKSCQLKGSGSILIGDYVRIDYETDDSNSIVIYTSNLVPIQFASIKNDTLKNNHRYEFNLMEHKDIVIKGVCFIKCTKPLRLNIYTIKDIKPYERDNLI